MAAPPQLGLTRVPWAPVLRGQFPSEVALAATYEKFREHFEHCAFCRGSYSNPDALCRTGKGAYDAWNALACKTAPKTR